MTDAEPAESSTPSRKHRHHVRRERAHRRRRQVIALAATIVVLAAGAAVATDTVRLSTQERPSLAGTVRTPNGRSHSTASTSTTLPALPCRATLTSTEPLKVWVGGDSLAGSLGPTFGAIAGATGVVQPYFHSRVSSGLSNSGFVDWPALATKEMASVSPEIVVFIISTNDYGVPMNKTVDTSGEPAWKATYTKQVEDMLQILEGSGRTVLWLGAPVLKDTTQNDGVKELNAVEKDVVKKHRNAEYVDTYALFADRDGKYSANVTDEDGKTIVARAGDGVHLTPDGANYLARAVYKLVDAQCRVTAHAVTGATKQTIQTQGSTQVAPGSGGSGGSVATTPPASSATTSPSASTSPPTATTPPTTVPTASTSPSTTTTTAKAPPP